MVDRYILDGRVVTMDDKFSVHDPGRIYVDGTTIAAVQPAAAPAPDGWDDATVVRTGDTIYPGLIELHNHLSYDALPLWQVPQRFDNRGQWMRHRDYRRFVSGPASVLGRTGGFLEAVVRYVEAKCLVAGVTTSQGIALASNMGIRRFYKGLVRNVEDSGEDALPAAGTRVADVEGGSARKFLEALERKRSSSLLLHLAEGVDDAARQHFRSLRIGPDEWAITPSLAGIHCAGLTGRDYQIFRARGGSMIWSPLSNLLLYGGTADIQRAADERLPMALGSDWSPSGSKNLLGELKVAWLVSEARGGVFSGRELVAMATVNPARILKWDAAVGSIEAGKRADLVLVDGRRGDPYEHLLRARESALTMVVVDGAPRYGQPRLMKPFTTGRRVERRTVGGADRVVDLTDASADPLVGALSLADAEGRLIEGLRDLPELARVLESPVTAGAALGASDGTTPGMWFLELDHEDGAGMSDRPSLGGLDVWNGAGAHGGPGGNGTTGGNGARGGAGAGTGGGAGTGTGAFAGPAPLWARGAADPLSEVLGPLDLDPLTVVDDDRYIDRLAGVPELSDEGFEVVRGLARLYGHTAPARRPAGTVPATPEARRAARPDVGLGEAAAGTAQGALLADFLEGVGDGTLTLADRLLLVEQALVMIEQCYVHLVLKQAMHAVDPVQRLRLLRDRLAMLTEDTRGPEVAFHRELADIFASVRDLHTNYLLPAPFRGRTAFLPFLVERFVDPPGAGVEGGGEHFIVSKVAAGLAHPTFVPEVEVLHWNGTPVRRAVEANARLQAGSNVDASFARGLDALTIRPLVRSLPPDDDWVVVTYRGLDGTEREIRLDWQVATAAVDGSDGTGLGRTGRSALGLAGRAAQGVDIEVQAVNEAKKLMFAVRAVEAQADIAAPSAAVSRVAVGAADLATSMPTVFRARPVTTPSGTFGHIRIFTFGVDDADEFVAEFVRLAGLLPAVGLVVDVRGNGGGLIHASERLLQVLTPRPIAPEPTQMTTTPLMLDLSRRHAPSPLDPTFDLAPWVTSLRQAVSTGAQYSNGFTITDEASANAVGQRYHGPVVLVTDALCYSATDIFAAGFQDHAIGPVLGVDGNTGAGGANVWTHDLFKLLLDTPANPGNPFVDLPAGAGFRVSVRRTLRVGAERGGTPVEDLGIVPDERHHLTRADIVGANDDLLARAGELLAARPSYTLALDGPAEVRPDGKVRLRLTTAGLDRVDVAVDGRPVTSLDVTDRTSTHTLRPATPSPSRVGLTGWSAGVVVARRHEPL
jgi:cytosine/adenosine deaminase-related metal-dependent hydrolase/C-terminal processing protease CtpA/Prc